jgi:hypothetical protein
MSSLHWSVVDCSVFGIPGPDPMPVPVFDAAVTPIFANAKNAWTPLACTMAATTAVRTENFNSLVETGKRQSAVVLYYDTRYYILTMLAVCDFIVKIASP